ncbi:MAG: acyl-CoA synthetase [Actinomycetota bacterium]|nr:acyl-CoA synthetase [Actinomycetota bacterium]
MTAGWNFAEIWERIADLMPDTVVQVHGDRSYTWGEFDRRADGIAATLLAGGAQHQDKVAHYLYNCPEFMESMFGMYKAGLAPVNTNYRYTDDELEYLWENSDTVAVVFHGTFTARCAAMRSRTPRVHTWIWVDDDTEPCPEWAIPYETAAASAPGRTIPPWARSGDDLYLIYTGGTTGFPKGVMWRQDDVIGSLDNSSKIKLPAEPGWDVFDSRITGPGPRVLPGAPLMHGTGAFNAMSVLMNGGSIVTMTGRHFDPAELLDTIQQYKATTMSIVGDAFAKPILRALDAEPDRWDFSSMRVIVSSGVIWAAETKAGLLRHNARLIMVDTLGSSEAIGMAANTTKAGESKSTAKFSLGPNTRVLTEDGREVQAGSGERGRVALRGRTPIGYYKDPVKSADTFIVHDGVRWSIPGDWAEVEADGTLKLYGRGSQCINTGGEKVYPEEVEEALKLHPSVNDAAVVGVPDDRFGEAITALVQLHDGHTLDEKALIAYVREHHAAYKSPKRVLQIPTIGRAANGKLNYKTLRDEALRQLGIS